MMKEPAEVDFKVKVSRGVVEVTFTPTNTGFVYDSRGVRNPHESPPTIVSSANGDTYWSNSIENVARRIARNRLPSGRLRRSSIGAAIGAALYFLLLGSKIPSGYIPQTLIGIVVYHVIALIPFVVIGASMGFFSSVAMPKRNKAMYGAVIGVGFGCFVTAFVVAMSGGAMGSVGFFLMTTVSWTLLWAGIGYGSGQRA